MTKTTKRVLAIAIPLVIGIGIIILLNRGPKRSKNPSGDRNEPEPYVKPASSGSSGSSSSFPLKKGSRNEYVSKLQNALISAYGSSLLPKYGADGDWGTETDIAVKAKLNITQIATEAELNQIIASMKASAQAAATLATEVSKANQIISSWKANPNLKLMMTKKTAAQEVTLDYQNKINGIPGEYVNIDANDALSRGSFEPYLATTDGWLVVKFSIGGTWFTSSDKGYCIFRPSNTTLV